MSAIGPSGHILQCTCPLSGVKRTWRLQYEMSACDPKRTLAGASSDGVDVGVDLGELLFVTIRQNRSLQELIMLDRIIDWLFGTGETIPQIPADVPHHELLRGFGILLLILLVLFLVSSIGSYFISSKDQARDR